MTEYLTDPENKNNIENNNIENIEASENIGNVENIENIENIKKRILSALGLAARAGALVYGTDMICETLRKTPESNSNNKNTAKNRKKVLLVIEASDTSDNTHKKLTDKCSYYRTEHIKTDNIDAATLAHAVGKSGGIAAVALTDENFVKLLKKAF